MKLVLAALAAALLAPAAAQAQAQAPAWAQTPGLEDVDAVFPEKAIAEGVGGRAALRCAVMATGALEACEITRDEPAGFGFGAALLALAPKFRLAAPAPGAALPQTLTVPMRFAPPPRAAKFQTRFRGQKTEGPGPYTPERAARMAQSGIAIIECVADGTGALTECTRISETPEDFDFLSAAMHMAKIKWMTVDPRIENGAPVPRETVRVLVVFDASKYLIVPKGR